MKPVIIIAIAFVLLFIPSTVFAESEIFTVAARSYEQKVLNLIVGDYVEFSIQVQGGKNNDINLIVDIPGEDRMEGRVIGTHSDTFTAPSSGSYVFTFDNTISKISNKSVLFSYDITKNTYYVYVENIPEYAKDHAVNAVLDATEYWKSVFPKKNFYVVDSKSNADILIQWVKDFTGMKHVGFQYVRLIEIGLGDSKCLGQWNPYSSKHVTEITTHEIGHAIGLEHSDNPNSIMYPTASRTEYGNVYQQFNMGKNQGMFIPLCLSQEPSSIQYSVETTDSKSGFDVYVVPSKKDFDNILQEKPFVYYSDDKCFGEGFLKYPGQCKGTIYGSGLAIIHGSQLSSSTASISVNYFEIDYNGNPSPYDTKIYSQTPSQSTIEKELRESSIAKIEKELRESFAKIEEESKKTSAEITEERKLVCGTGTIEKNGQCVSDTNNSSKGGGCLIATATYGSELAPQVQQLRELRDNQLLNTESGTSFINSFNEVYYSFSPYIADYERENPVFKEIVKIVITPMISSLSILNYVDMDSESSVLGYGISLILLNVGMYFATPAIIILKIKKKF